MNYRRIKAVAIAVLFLVAGALYSTGRNQDIFLYESSLKTDASGTETDASGIETDASGTKTDASGIETDASETETGVSAAADTRQPLVHVHVCGAVKEAGVYLLSADAIVKDAVEAAGGIVEGGAEDYLNLAGTVSEGDKIYVPFLEDLDDPYGVAGQTAAGTAGGAKASSEREPGGLVNINTADKSQLVSLPGIGETRAEAIISYRESNGDFQKIEDIMKVSGIKEGAFEKIKDQITV